MNKLHPLLQNFSMKQPLEVIVVELKCDILCSLAALLNVSGCLTHVHAPSHMYVHAPCTCTLTHVHAHCHSHLGDREKTSVCAQLEGALALSPIAVFMDLFVCLFVCLS